MNTSVIIPVYNEADIIGETIRKVRCRGGNDVKEIIVVDGGSGDSTLREAGKWGAKILQAPQKGRAAQMNYGAEHAAGGVLYFLHADTHPPPHFTSAVIRAVEAGYDAGCFRLAFDEDHWLLNAYAWFTRFDINMFRFGDQSLFITHAAFSQLNGFREDHMVMEDQEMVRRIKRSFSFVLMEDEVTTAARKYQSVGVVKLQLVFGLILTLYYLGVGQHELVSIYKRFIQ